jgi:hypothetical protein
MRRKIIRLSTVLTIVLGMVVIFGLGFYALSSVTDANLTVKGASGKAGTTNNLVSIEVTSNVAVRGIQFTLKDDPDVLIPTAVSLNPPVSGASLAQQDYPVEGLSVIIESDSGIVIPAGGKQRIDILYNVAANTPDMQVALAPIDVKLADNTTFVNPITTTVSNSFFSIVSETIPPTIYGPYVGDLCHAVPVNGKSFSSDVTMWWLHYDNSGGSGIDTNKVTAACKLNPNGDYVPLTLNAGNLSGGGSFVFPVSWLSLYGTSYTIKISVSDKAGNTQITTATVYINKPPTTPNITFSKNPVNCGESFTFTATSTDPNGDSLTYWWAWQYPGQTSPGGWWKGTPPQGPISQTTPGVHTVYCKTVDAYGASSPTGSATLTVQ